MAETTETTRLKRKASPETDANEAASKRPRSLIADRERENTRTSTKRDAAPDEDLGKTREGRCDDRPVKSRQSPGPETQRGTSLSGSDRRDIDQEEKKRGRRLFGGLLHTLSQPASNSGQQKRRQDAERRQLEKAQNQRVEDDKRRLERLSNILHIRETEQVKFHDEVVCFLLAWASADGLSTHVAHSSVDSKTKRQSPYVGALPVHQSRPKPGKTPASFMLSSNGLSIDLCAAQYYVPWKLTPSQEATLDRQEQDAEDLSMRSTQTISRPKETSPGNVGQLSEPKSLRDTNKDKEAPLKTSHEKEHDEGGDEMVQDNEDSVLY